jgi:S1-C subfamily serine protease
MKKSIIAFIFGILLMFSVNVFAEVLFQESQYSLYVDGVKIEQPVYTKDYVNYVPLWAVTQAMGIETKIDGFRIDISKPTLEPALTDVEAVAKKCKDSCVMIYAYSQVPGGTKQTQGSGFAYNGYIVTARHVVEGPETINISVDDARYATVGLIHYIDKTHDLAILKVGAKVPSVTLGDSEALKDGEKLISITSPGGMQNSIDECVNSGKTWYDSKRYLTVSESAMDGGSSGGAVFNAKGELVGMSSNGEGESHTAILINDIKLTIINNTK